MLALRQGRLSANKIFLPKVRSYAVYSEKPVPKSERKPLVHGVLFDPKTVQDIKNYRIAKEYHVFKRRYELPLMQAYCKFLEESEAERIAEKKGKRKARREETAHIRRRDHIAQQKKQQLIKETMIIRPWEKAIREMEDTFSWSMLKNPFFGETDEMNKYDLHEHFTPKTLLPIESWLFWNRDSWEDVPYLSNLVNPSSNSLDGLIRNSFEDKGILCIDDETDESDFEVKVQEDHEIRGSDGQLKEHMIYDPDTARLALQHEDQYRVNRQKQEDSENWIPKTNHGYSLDNPSDEKYIVEEPLMDMVDTDFGESDFYHEDLIVPSYGTQKKENILPPKTPHENFLTELIEKDDNIPFTKDGSFFMNPGLSPPERQAVFNTIQILINMPDRGTEKKWKDSVNPDHLSLILRGAERAGLSISDFNFIKEFLQYRRKVSNQQLDKFKDLLSNGFREKLLGGVDAKEYTENSVISYNLDGTTTTKSKEEYKMEAAGLSPSSSTKSNSKKDKDFGINNNNENNENDKEVFIDSDYFSANESPIEEALEEDHDSSEDEDLNSVNYTEYAIKIKEALDYQMREQLMEYGILCADTSYMLADPPILGTDLDPCVEIIHVSHIQSLTRYERLEHVQRKVVFKINMTYLNFPPEVMDRFQSIVGGRYNPETGIFKYVSKAHHNKHQNTIHGMKQIQKLFEASFEALPSYLPIDEYHNPEDTVGDCNTNLKVYEMYEEPYIRPKPWLEEPKKLKSRDPYFVFRPFPFGWKE